jgi:predicted PurR-regulated permease PerM
MRNLPDMPAQIKLTQRRGTTLINLAVAALIIAALYVGREIFVPVALAVLLSFVLAPFILRMQSWRVPRTLSVLVVVFFGFSIIFSLGGLMVSQASRLAGELPGYQQTLKNKVDSIRGLTGGSGTLERASKVLKELNTELQNSQTAGRPLNSGLVRQPTDKPIPVEVKQPDPGALTTLVAIIEPLLSPLTTTGVVVIFVVFILLQRQDLRNRFVRLAGSEDIQRTTAALDEAGERLSRLFLTQIAFNAAFGLAIGIGLELIGVYGGASPGSALVFVDTDAGWNPLPSVQTVQMNFVLNRTADASIVAKVDAPHDFFAPELARIFGRQIAVLDRMVPNFISTSTKQPPPGDSWASLKPWRPTLYPEAPKFRELPPADATLLVEFYGSLQEISDTIDSLSTNEATTIFNAWNVLMHKARNNLSIGENAVLKFCPDRPFNVASPAAGTLLNQSKRAIAGAHAAMSAHLARHGVS